VADDVADDVADEPRAGVSSTKAATTVWPRQLLAWLPHRAA